MTNRVLQGEEQEIPTKASQMLGPWEGRGLLRSMVVPLLFLALVRTWVEVGVGEGVRGRLSPSEPWAGNSLPASLWPTDSGPLRSPRASSLRAKTFTEEMLRCQNTAYGADRVEARQGVQLGMDRSSSM